MMTHHVLKIFETILGSSGHALVGQEKAKMLIKI